MGEELDDYMSDDFLKVVQDVKPGLAVNSEHRRQLKITANRLNRREEALSIPKKHELEKSLREEALSKPISESSKGFALLAKMGFKPGMSLGKKKDDETGSGLKEPIPIEFKACRTGLGHENEQEKQAKLRLQREMDRMKRRAENNEALADEYTKRRRGIASTKYLIRDILTSRKVCNELDLRMNIEVPKVPWFWKSYRQRKTNDGCAEGCDFDGELEDTDEKYVYSNGREAPEEVRFDELAEEVLRERLLCITTYLRETQRYCIWCGCQFEDFEELSSYCPGQDREAHDSTDD